MPFPFLIPAFFLASWILMMFWGMASPGLGIPTIGYPTAMLITIGLWLVVFPLARGKGGMAPAPMMNMGWGRSNSKQAKSGRKAPGDWESSSEDFVNISTSFSAVSRNIRSRAFRGGTVNANFGGVKLDLRGCSLAPGGATLNVKAFMGGVELIVPREWDVRLDVSASLGGVEDGRSRPGPYEPGAPTLVITGSAVLGGIDLKND